MQGNVQQLTEQYQAGMKALFEAHEDQMAKAQASYEEAIAQAKSQFETLMAGNKDPQPVKQTPQAVWTKAPDGEDILVLNREAAIMQMALLDRLAEVLVELTKLAPGKK